MKEVKAYKCDYCGKLYMRYKPALNHEQNICVILASTMNKQMIQKK
jgi:hypothetical protein